MAQAEMVQATAANSAEYGIPGPVLLDGYFRGNVAGIGRWVGGARYA